MTIFVDSSAIFAYLDRDDRYHSRARGALEVLVATDELLTSNYVVLESAVLVRGRLGSTLLRDLMEVVVPSMSVVWVDSQLHGSAVSAHLASAQRKASLVDWVSFEVMRSRSLTRAFTFDRDFRAQGFEVVP